MLFLLLFIYFQSGWRPQRFYLSFSRARERERGREKEGGREGGREEEERERERETETETERQRDRDRLSSDAKPADIGIRAKQANTNIGTSARHCHKMQFLSVRFIAHNHLSLCPACDAAFGNRDAERKSYCFDLPLLSSRGAVIILGVCLLC